LGCALGFDFQTAEIVIASAAKQSMEQQERKSGLLRCARNDGKQPVDNPVDKLWKTG
jgi:hypothetical protein